MRIKGNELDRDFAIWLYYFGMATLMLSGIILYLFFALIGFTYFWQILIFLVAVFGFSMWQLLTYDVKRQTKQKKKKEEIAHERKEELEGKIKTS